MITPKWTKLRLWHRASIHYIVWKNKSQHEGRSLKLGKLCVQESSESMRLKRWRQDFCLLPFSGHSGMPSEYEAVAITLGENRERS